MCRTICWRWVVRPQDAWQCIVAMLAQGRGKVTHARTYHVVVVCVDTGCIAI
jgi:hypothetical protein